MTLAIALVAGGLALHAVWAASETALVSADRQVLGERRNAGAGTALALLDGEHHLVAATLTGRTLSMALVGVGAVMLRPDAWPIAVVAATALVVLFAETLPRALARSRAEGMAMGLAPVVRATQVLLAPVTVAAAALLARLVREPPISREALVRMIDEDTEGIAPSEHRLIRRVLGMSGTTVAACMTPLVQVHAVDVDADLGTAADLLSREGHSNLPVYRDRVDNLIGLVTSRDLLFRAEGKRTVADLMRPVAYVPESKRADDLLADMRRDHDHFAVVVDEYGGAVGVVTLEDLLEELVGEIHDERDRDQPVIKKVGEREWRVPARVGVAELATVLGAELPEGDYETVAGLLLSVLGRIPEVGEVVRVDRWIFRIESATPRAIQVVHLTLPSGAVVRR